MNSGPSLHLIGQHLYIGMECKIFYGRVLKSNIGIKIKHL